MNPKAPRQYNPPNINPDCAVIIGAGQFTADVAPDIQTARGPAFMAAQAVKAAISDSAASGIKAHIDTVFCVRTFSDSGPVFASPFLIPQNMPAAIADMAGIKARRYVYGVIGGNTPQSLIAQAAEDIELGLSDAALICGGEAIANMKAARRAGAQLDWSYDIDAPLENKGYFDMQSPPIMSASEKAHAFYTPIECYTVLENALRRKHGRSRESYLSMAAHMFSGLLKTAKSNPFAAYGDIDTDFKSFGAGNSKLTDLYGKAVLPKDTVNQGAAVIVMRFKRAVQMGLDPARFIYLHAHVEGSEPPILHRPDLDSSPVMKACFRQALAAAGVEKQDITLRDLYSCFPIVAAQSAAELGLDARREDISVTGGLPFFGGPGNNYSLHATASLVTRLRAAPQSYGLIYANGGYMSKHAVGIYSARPPAFPIPIMRHMAESGPVLAITDKAEGTGVIESFCVNYKKGRRDGGIVIGRMKESGARFCARPDKSRQTALLKWLEDEDPFGADIVLSPDEAMNRFSRA